MSLGDYIDEFILNTNDAGEGAERLCGYLAQYQLLEQLTALRRDIVTPSVCSALASEDTEAPPWCETRNESPLTSAWLGPAGTVSPLHNDPYHNVLVQVVGYKYIRIYGAEQTHRLYPREAERCNSSQVDLDEFEGRHGHSGGEADPRAQFPLFEGAPFWQCVLGPGDGLYIPRHAWHYVRSLTPSFSVSFWWGARMGLAPVDAIEAGELRVGRGGGGGASSSGATPPAASGGGGGVEAPRYQAVY